MNAPDIQEYLNALAAQRKAEQAGDMSAAGRLAHRAASLFFVMTPQDQTTASREAKKMGLA